MKERLLLTGVYGDHSCPNFSLVVMSQNQIFPDENNLSIIAKVFDSMGNGTKEPFAVDTGAGYSEGAVQ